MTLRNRSHDIEILKKLARPNHILGDTLSRSLFKEGLNEEQIKTLARNGGLTEMRKSLETKDKKLSSDKISKEDNTNRNARFAIEAFTYSRVVNPRSEDE